MNKEQIHSYVEPTDKERGEKLAAKWGWSMSLFVKTAYKEFLQKHKHEKTK